ncbi:hypothetical protein L6252_03265 [Candidatus Parcubacteria bacterium]|nr:hypothetical protein [Candidatus Parcubacteria bacterium]
MANPKFYFDNFLVGDREKKIFVFMPFLLLCKERYDKVIKPVAEFLDFDIEKADDGKSGKEIMEKVFEGINNSRALVFDLSRDERYNYKVNPNVAYELGIARMVRSDTDILLITDMEDVDKEIFFDIRAMNIIKIGTDFTKDSFCDDVKQLLQKQKYYEDKRIEMVSKLIDDESIELMYKYGRRPSGYKHFNSRGVGPEKKMSALRLLDMGVVKTSWVCYRKGFECAYHWTSFGEAVMKYMGMVEIGLEEFKGTPDYQTYLRFEKYYKEQKSKMV